MFLFHSDEPSWLGASHRHDWWPSECSDFRVLSGSLKLCWDATCCSVAGLLLTFNSGQTALFCVSVLVQWDSYHSIGILLLFMVQLLGCLFRLGVQCSSVDRQLFANSQVKCWIWLFFFSVTKAFSLSSKACFKSALHIKSESTFRWLLMGCSVTVHLNWCYSWYHFCCMNDKAGTWLSLCLWLVSFTS